MHDFVAFEPSGMDYMYSSLLLGKVAVQYVEGHRLDYSSEIQNSYFSRYYSFLFIIFIHFHTKIYITPDSMINIVICFIPTFGSLAKYSASLMISVRASVT